MDIPHDIEVSSVRGGYIVSLLDPDGSTVYTVTSLGHVFEHITAHLTRIDALSDADHETVRQAVRALRHKKGQQYWKDGNP